MAETKKLIEIPDYVTVRELAALMDLSAIEVIKELMRNGIMANINQQIDFDTASIVAEELGFDAEQPASEDEEAVEEHLAWRQVLAAERSKDLKSRPPVVTMLGHVDHGKTSLLDVFRETDVASGEAGGITQHIGAYQAVKDGQRITFLDTPGHAAFTSMRARGAQATDIAILVVAADDGVMPQTKEAIDHAKAARVPIIVALNKIDLPSAQPDRAKQQLAENGLIPDEWDGDTMIIPVSAKEKLGMDDLLEAILLVAEDIDPKANPAAPATGTILEARKERGRGVMTTVLVQNGTLKQGDTLLTNGYYGRIRAMYNSQGLRTQKAFPSTPVAVAGLNGIPEAGDQFRVVGSEREARKIVAEWEAQQVHTGVSPTAASLEAFFAQMQDEEKKDLNLVIKADVQGSLEPIIDSLSTLSNEEVTVEILHAATGNITESDVMLAAASGAIVLGFNVKVDPIAKAAANSERVEINFYSIIYKLIEDVEKALKGMLAPVYRDKLIGRAEVRQVFRIRGIGNIAGSFMRTGETQRNAQARVIRDKKLLYSGKIGSLKHLQENVREVKTGFEFGVSVEGWTDYKTDDIIEFFVSERVYV